VQQNLLDTEVINYTILFAVHQLELGIICAVV